MNTKYAEQAINKIYKNRKMIDLNPYLTQKETLSVHVRNCMHHNNH